MNFICTIFWRRGEGVCVDVIWVWPRPGGINPRRKYAKSAKSKLLQINAWNIIPGQILSQFWTNLDLATFALLMQVGATCVLYYSCHWVIDVNCYPIFWAVSYLLLSPRLVCSEFRNWLSSSSLGIWGLVDKSSWQAWRIAWRISTSVQFAPTSPHATFTNATTATSFVRNATTNWRAGLFYVPFAVIPCRGLP